MTGVQAHLGKQDPTAGTPLVDLLKLHGAQPGCDTMEQRKYIVYGDDQSAHSTRGDVQVQTMYYGGQGTD